MVLGIAVLIGIGFLGALHPALDTFSHFRLHLAVILFSAGIIFLFVRRFWRGSLCMLVAAIALTTTMVALPWTSASIPPIADKPIYSLFHLNLLWSNRMREQVIERIHEIDPDFISVTEVNNRWEPYLKSLDETWPHLVQCPEWQNFGGIKIYSRWPFQNDDDFCGSYGSFVKTKVQLPNTKELTLGSVHPRWPWPASGPEQYASFQPILNALGKDALIVGDFNATPWSYSVRHFAGTGKLSSVGSIGGTWLHERLPAWTIRTFGLPIDLVMKKGDIHIISAKSLENFGSDHLPIVVKFQF